MRLHAEMPLVTLLGLVHLRIAGLVFVLCRRRRGDDRGIDNCALAHQQAALLQHRPDLVEQHPGQVVFLQPMAEVQHCRRVRYRHHRQVDPGKPAQGLAIVQRVLQSLVGQPIPLLQKVKPQHPLQPDRRPAALALWIEWPQTIDQPRPRHHPLHLGQKLVPTSLLFLPGVFRLRKAPLPPHRPVPRSPRTGRFYPMPAPPGPFFSLSLRLERHLENLVSGSAAALRWYQTAERRAPRRRTLASTPWFCDPPPALSSIMPTGSVIFSSRLQLTVRRSRSLLIRV